MEQHNAVHILDILEKPSAVKVQFLGHTEPSSEGGVLLCSEDAVREPSGWPAHKLLFFPPGGEFICAPVAAFTYNIINFFFTPEISTLMFLLTG